MSDYFDVNDRYLKWRYTIAECRILFPNGANYEEMNLPTERVTSFSIYHDYENNIFPLFRITITLEATEYYKILEYADGTGVSSEENGEDSNKLRFKLDIRKLYVPTTGGEKSVKFPFINGVFYLILDDEAYYSEEGYRQLEAASDMTTMMIDKTRELHHIENNMEFFLFRATDIESSRVPISAVLHNTTVANAINYIISKLSISKVLMSKPSNRNTSDTYSSYVLDEIVIPPLPAFQAIQFVDSYYGLYDTGAMIYSDFDYLYILKYGDKCDAYEEGEFKEVTIMIPKKGSRWTIDVCTVDKENNATQTYYVVANNTNVTIRNDANTYNVLVGNDILAVDSYEGAAVSDESGAKTTGGSIEKVIENVTENPFFASTYTAQASARGNILTLQLGNIDVDYLKPNRIFNVIFEDTKVNKTCNGKYKMVTANHTFVKRGTEFTQSTELVLKNMSLR